MIGKFNEIQGNLKTKSIMIEFREIELYKVSFPMTVCELKRKGKVKKA